MFDPLVRAKEVEKLILIKRKRKYYRFRFARYYGGIVTADAVGCCFLCAYCWNYFRNLKPDKIGKFYSAKEVAERLISISTKKKCKRIRISGAEPILGKESFNHLIELISILKERFKRSMLIYRRERAKLAELKRKELEGKLIRVDKVINTRVFT